MAMNLHSILRLAFDLYRLEGFSLDLIKKIQWNHFQEIFNFARTSSPFYRELYKNHTISNAHEIVHLPLVDKKIIMDNFDSVVTVQGITKARVMEYLEDSQVAHKIDDKYTIIHSSGTSGFLWISVFDDNCFKYEIASTLARKFRKFSFCKPSLAVVASTNPHVGSTVFYKGISPFLATIKHFSVKNRLPVLIEHLNEFNPLLLGAYPGILKLLAQEKLNRNLTINPKRIFCGGYVLPDETKEHVNAAFGQYPYEIYAATEVTGPIAVECVHHSLHVFLDSIMFEVLDDNNKPVEPGNPGKVVITNLLNYTQPIIRYQLQDIVQMAKDPCPCGSPFPVIEKIWGREGDLIYIKRRDGVMEVIDPILFNFKIDGLEMLRVIQHSPNELLLLLVVKNEECKNSVIKEAQLCIEKIICDKNLSGEVNVRYEIVNEIPLINGRHKLVVVERE